MAVCPHESVHVDADGFVCVACATPVDGAPVPVIIAAIRDVLATKRFKPRPVAVEPTAAPPLIPRKDP